MITEKALNISSGHVPVTFVFPISLTIPGTSLYLVLCPILDSNESNIGQMCEKSG